MTDKTVLITGGTSGIGAAAARELAKRGARVVVIGRDPARIDATLAAIREATGRDDASGLLGDLGTFDGVRRLADAVCSRHDRLDVLVNNAGAAFETHQLNPDGIERTFALNHFAYFLLTNLLIDLLKRSAPSRVVNVASDAHRFARRIHEANLQSETGYAGMRAYSESKLANILFSNELARRLEGTGVTSNALHPGFVRTRFFETGTGIGGWLVRRFAEIGAITPESGARTTVYLASSPEVEGVSGKYFVRCREVVPSSAARDPEAARRLWDLSAEWTGLSAS